MRYEYPRLELCYVHRLRFSEENNRKGTNLTASPQYNIEDYRTVKQSQILRRHGNYTASVCPLSFYNVKRELLGYKR